MLHLKVTVEVRAKVVVKVAALEQNIATTIRYFKILFVFKVKHIIS